MKPQSPSRPLTVGNLMAILAQVDPRLIIIGEKFSDHWDIVPLKDGVSLLMLERTDVG